MNFVIFIISLIGICCIVYTITNYDNVKIEENNTKYKLSIVLNVDNVDYYSRKIIIEKILCGNYENLMDFVLCKISLRCKSMYAFFKGKIDNIFKDRIIIDVNDIGYEIYMPESSLYTLEVGNLVKVYTYLHVREDEMRLFGFLSSSELELFKKLITVSGVGPKGAIGIISKVDIESLCIAIATEDLASLKSVPGVGPKMAQKIIFELKDKVLKEQIDTPKYKEDKVNIENINEAMTALEVLGYSQKQLKEVMSKLDLKNDSVETIIRKVLKEMQNI